MMCVRVRSFHPCKGEGLPYPTRRQAMMSRGYTNLNATDMYGTRHGPYAVLLYVYYVLEAQLVLHRRERHHRIQAALIVGQSGGLTKDKAVLWQCGTSTTSAHGPDIGPYIQAIRSKVQVEEHHQILYKHECYHCSSRNKEEKEMGPGNDAAPAHSIDDLMGHHRT